MQSVRSSPLISVKSDIQSSPKWSFKARPRDGRTNETPGPGAYSVTSPESSTRFAKSPNYGFGNGSRDGYNRPQSAPGPGQYSPASANGTSAKHVFGTSSRRVSDRGRDQPGPGSYKVDTDLGQNSPKYTANTRREFIPTVDSPGPGAYQPNFTMSSSKSLDPKWGFSRSPREGSRLYNNPGPGEYNVDAARRGPRYTIPTRKDNSRPSTTPGPGSHGPMYTMFG